MELEGLPPHTWGSKRKVLDGMEWNDFYYTLNYLKILNNGIQYHLVPFLLINPNVAYGMRWDGLI